LATLNSEKLGTGLAVETIAWRADKDYLIQSTCMESPTQSYTELETSQTDVRGAGVLFDSHAMNSKTERAIWHGLKEIHRDTYLLAHFHYTANGDLLKLRVEVIPA